MSTVTTDQYQLITGDSTTPVGTVQTLLDVAEGFVEEYLRRQLASQEYTERCRIWPMGTAFPRNTPITDVPAESNYVIHNTATIMGAGGDADGIVSDYPVNTGADMPHNLPYGTVTYTGGWTSETIPSTLQFIICKIAQGFTAPQNITPGVSKASVGDVSVDYASASDQSIDALYPGASAALLQYRYRPR